MLYLQSETYFHYILFYSKFVGIESSNYVIVGSAAVVGDAIGRVIRCVASVVMSATFFASMAAMSTATTTIAAETAASTTVAAISTATIGAAVESIVTAVVPAYPETLTITKVLISLCAYLTAVVLYYNAQQVFTITIHILTIQYNTIE